MQEQPRPPIRDEPPQEPGQDFKAELAKLAFEAPPEPLHAGARLRNYFLTGLVVVGPVTITLYIAWYFINIVDAWVKPYIPRIYNPESYLPFPVPGVGLVFAIVGLTLIGALAANLLGRSLISAGELMVGRMPIVRNVYQGLKQIFESVVTASAPSQSFQKVALMEFPSKGIWSIVFVTGEATEQIAAELPGEDLISVFMPTGMLPPSGFVCFVPRASVVPVKMSVEDAAKIIISAGMVNPETQARFKEMVAKGRNGGRPAALPASAPHHLSTPPAA
jgi:uncharacterized membrane protein